MDRKPLKLFLITGGCLLLLSGCSWLEDWPPGGQAKAPYPEDVKVVKAADATWIEPAAGAAPATGDTSARLDALEAEVRVLRNDLSTMMPALTRLATAQEDLGRVLAAMAPAAGTMIGQQPAAVPAMPAATGGIYQNEAGAVPQSLQPLAPGALETPRPAATASIAPPQQVAAVAPSHQPPVTDAAGGGAHVKGLRLGEHDDRTRVVLDVSDDVAFSYNLDNDENLLIVDLPGTQWAAAQQFESSPLVASFETVSSEQGTQVVLQLRQPSEVIWAQALPAAEGQGPRVVIDLAR